MGAGASTEGPPNGLSRRFNTLSNRLTRPTSSLTPSSFIRGYSVGVLSVGAAEDYEKERKQGEEKKTWEEELRKQKEHEHIERKRLLHWKFWTSSMMNVMSFLSLEEDIPVVLFVSKTWCRIGKRFWRDFVPALPTKELEWIQNQLEQNSSFFEKTMITNVCKLTLARRIPSVRIKRAELQQLVQNLPEVIELQQRIRHHRGHYATYPALAMQLLSSLGKATEATKVHEQTFRCKLDQRRQVMASIDFLVLVFQFMDSLFQDIKDLLDEAKEQLYLSVQTVLDREAEQFTQNRDDADGRSVSVQGILASDLLENIYSFQNSLERKMGIVTKELKAKIQVKLASKLEHLNSMETPEQVKYGFVLELTEEESNYSELKRLFRKHTDYFFKAFSQAYLEPVMLESTAPEAYVDALLQRVQQHLDKTNPSGQIKETYHELIGIFDSHQANVLSGQDTEKDLRHTLFSENYDFLRAHYPGLPSYSAIARVDTEIDRYLDWFLDRPTKPASERALVPTSDETDEESASSLPSSGTSLSLGATQGLLPQTREEVEDKPLGWFLQHLGQVYIDAMEELQQQQQQQQREQKTEEKTCQHSSAETIDEWKAILKDYAMRRYLYHALQKENANRALSFAPRGVVTLPLDKRREHMQLLTAAIRSALARDFGELEDGLRESSAAFFHRLQADDEFAKAIISMSLNSLVGMIEEKRKQMAEFEKARRKSDLD